MIGVLLLLESDSVVEQVALLVEGKLVAEKVDCSQCMSKNSQAVLAVFPWTATEDGGPQTRSLVVLV